MYWSENQNPHLTAKILQQDLADTGAAVHCSTVQRCSHKQDLHGGVSRRKPYLRPHHKIQRQKYEKEHLQKPDVFWKQVLQTDEVKKRILWPQSAKVCLEKNRSSIS